MEKLIRAVLITLGKIEVRGKENLDCMLSCMRALEKIADALRQNRETLGKEAPGPCEPGSSTANLTAEPQQKEGYNA